MRAAMKLKDHLSPRERMALQMLMKLEPIDGRRIPASFYHDLDYIASIGIACKRNCVFIVNWERIKDFDQQP